MTNQSELHKELKKRLIEHYSNGTNRCKCCGENHIQVLAIDHIYNDGARDKHLFTEDDSISGRYSNKKFYKWLEENNYPEGYQILCINCNTLKRTYQDYCPHHPEIRLSGEIDNRREIPSVLVGPHSEAKGLIFNEARYSINLGNPSAFENEEKYRFYFNWWLCAFTGRG